MRDSNGLSVQILCAAAFTLMLAGCESSSNAPLDETTTRIEDVSTTSIDVDTTRAAHELRRRRADELIAALIDGDSERRRVAAIEVDDLLATLWRKACIFGDGQSSSSPVVTDAYGLLWRTIGWDDPDEWDDDVDFARAMHVTLCRDIAALRVPEEATELLTLGLSLLEDRRDRSEIDAGFHLVSAFHHPEADAAIIASLEAFDFYTGIRNAAIAEIGRRGLKAASARIEALASHRNHETRALARAAARDLGITPADEPDEREASIVVVKEWLRRISQATDPVVAHDAPWVRIDTEKIPRTRGRGGSVRGSSGGIRFGRILPTSTQERLDMIDWRGVQESLPAENGSIRAATILEAVEAIEELRESVRRSKSNRPAEEAEALDRTVRDTLGDLHWHLFDRVPAEVSTRAEALLAAWAHVAGDDEIARRLVPWESVNEELLDDLQDVRDSLALDIETAMVETFARRRDYPETLRLALLLSSPAFEGYRHQELARRLAEQLPRRSADFVNLTLPRPAEFAHWKQSHSRDETIDYLADRLRLIVCPQMETPGSADWSGPQFPFTLHELRQRLSTWDREFLVNPVVELATMNLSPSEARRLLPRLTSEELMLGYWEIRFSGGEIGGIPAVATAVGNIIDKMLGGSSVSYSLLDGTRPEELSRHVAWLEERLRALE